MELQDTKASFPVEGLPRDCDLLNVVFRKPLVGDYVFSYTHWLPATKLHADVSRLVAVLSPPRKKWRNATADDVKRALQGEEVKCRVRDEPEDQFRDGVLVGARNYSPYRWYATIEGIGGCPWYAECQVPE